METYDERRARRKLVRDVAFQTADKALAVATTEQHIKCARWGAAQVCMDRVAGMTHLTAAEMQNLMESYLTKWLMRE